MSDDNNLDLFEQTRVVDFRFVKKYIQEGHIEKAEALINHVVFRVGVQLSQSKSGIGYDNRETFSHMWRYVNNIKLAPCGTARISLKTGRMEIDPDFLMRHMQKWVDFYFLVLHERNHIAYSTAMIPSFASMVGVTPGEFPKNLEAIVEDAFMNAQAYTAVQSKLARTFHEEAAKTEPLFRLLYDPFEDPLDVSVFGDRLVDLHTAMYISSYMRIEDFVGAIWEWWQKRELQQEQEQSQTENKGEGTSISFSNGMSEQCDETDLQPGQNEEQEDENDTQPESQPGQNEEQDSESETEEQPADDGKDAPEDGQEDVSDSNVDDPSDDTSDDPEDDECDDSETESGDADDPSDDPSDDNPLDNYQGLVQSMDNYVSIHPEDPAWSSKDGVSKIRVGGIGDWRDSILSRSLTSRNPNCNHFAYGYSMGKVLDQCSVSSLSSTIINEIGGWVGSKLSKYRTDNTIVGTTNIIPHSISRRDSFGLGMGQVPVMWQRPFDIGNKPMFHIYIDVSGSMTEWYNTIPRIWTMLSDMAGGVYQFSTIIKEIDPRSAKMEWVWTTSGTNFNTVAKHILQNHHRNVIMISDGECLLHSQYAKRLKDQLDTLYYIQVNGSSTYDPWFELATDILCINQQ